MPEGDTVHKIATYLASALVGQALSRVSIRGRERAELSSRAVLEVTSKGKHLLMSLAGGWGLRVHLGLYGTWHRYRAGQPWQKPAQRATLIIGAADQLYVCFNAKEVEVFSRRGYQARDLELRVGPDLTRSAPRIEQLLGRARELSSPETPVTDLLLDQRIASGIGNVYKSEVLFLEGCAPRTRLDQLAVETFASLYQTAGRLLMSNLGGGPRVTRPMQDGQGPLWVYGRAGLACLRCGHPVVREVLGRIPRSTYWCAGCQRIGGPASSAVLERVLPEAPG